MIEKEFTLHSTNDLEFRVYTIGYSRIGECVLTILCNGRHVLYCGLTDCYQKKTPQKEFLNIIHDIFKDYDNPKIDYFVWTHPDLDHSVGVSQVLSLYDPKCKARIFLPLELRDNSQYALSKYAAESIQFIQDNYMSSGLVEPIVVSDKEERDLISVVIKDIENKSRSYLDVFFLAPNGANVLQRISTDHLSKFNYMSIVYAVSLNGKNLIFAGDVEGDGINLSTKHLRDVIFLKIPHHGSRYSYEFANKLKFLGCQNITQNVTQKGQTPSGDNLAYYSDLGIVYVASDNTRSEDVYGYIQQRYNVNTLKLVEPPKLVGNAYQYK